MKLRQIKTLALLLISVFIFAACKAVSSIVPDSVNDPVYFGDSPDNKTMGPEKNKTLKNQIMNESY